MDLFIKIVILSFLTVGGATVLFSAKLAKRFGREPERFLEDKQHFMRENLRFKMYGLAVLLPAFILTLIRYAGS